MTDQKTEKSAWRNRLGNRELFLLLVMPALTALVLFSYFTFRYSRAQTEVQIISRLSDAADISTALMDQELANTQTLILTYSRGQTLQQVIEKKADPSTKQTLTDLWKTNNENNENLDFIMAVDLQGTPIASDPPALTGSDPNKIKAISAVKAALSGQPYLSPAIENPQLIGFNDKLV